MCQDVSFNSYLQFFASSKRISAGKNRKVDEAEKSRKSYKLSRREKSRNLNLSGRWRDSE